MARASETYTWGATHAADILSAQGYFDFGTTGQNTSLRVYADGRIHHIGVDTAPRPAPTGFSSISIVTVRTIWRHGPAPDYTPYLDDLLYYVFFDILVNYTLQDRGYVGSNWLERIGLWSDNIPGFRTPA